MKTNDIEKDISTKNNKISIKTIIISVILSFILTVSITISVNDDISISNFKVSSFDIEIETNSSEEKIFEGMGTISCTDTKIDYLAVIELNDIVNNEQNYDIVFIHDGKGQFTTYDYNCEKPDYKVNIVSFIKFYND